MEPGSANRIEHAAGNGLLNRRAFVQKSIVWLSATAAGSSMAATTGDSAPDWMKTPGAPFRGYGQPSPYTESAQRKHLQPYGEMAPGSGASVTPLQDLHGVITPNGLHFERSHNGVPAIDPEEHELIVHGMVGQALKFSYNDLLRYPTVTRTCFIECSGNGLFNSNLVSQPMQLPVGHLHGVMSTAEWTGVPLSILLDEAGMVTNAKWLLAEGADAAGMSRSIPVSKAMDDTMIALFQNGEPIRPEQGYPMRLLLPGFEGNTHVKWLRRIKVTDAPTYTKDETSKYSDLLPDGTANLFSLKMGVKSAITRPALPYKMAGKGFYEVSGLAWSGHGSVTRVEVSADTGRSWSDAELSAPILPMSPVRFRVPWHWDGSPSVLMSRAHDDQGNIQMPRSEWSAKYAVGHLYHNNSIQAWGIATDGEISNVWS
ncbi:MAG: sulfite dehydrogenase [Granulosicoccus sp.]|nr:sulfite dehydrogenase [Granulosicoccus sp.]